VTGVTDKANGILIRAIVTMTYAPWLAGITIVSGLAGITIVSGLARNPLTLSVRRLNGIYTAIPGISINFITIHS